MVEYYAGIVGACCCADRSLLANGDAIDLGGVTSNLAYGIAAIGRDAMSKALFAITDRNNALRVAVPGNVVDATGNNVIFT